MRKQSRTVIEELPQVKKFEAGDLDYVNSLKALFPVEQHLRLTLVGCGGTGSWLAPAVVRVARLLTERGHNIDVMFIDGDTVEEKNVYRQNFCDGEIGMNKAEALALRYGSAWGMEINAKAAHLTSKNTNGINHGVLIGCVDNAEARKTIAGLQTYGTCAWLDCGNERNNGQVLLGFTPGNTSMKSPFDLPGYCAWLPSPAVQHPELVKLSGVASGQSAALAMTQGMDLSCAEIALQDAQGLTINQRMAAEAADYLVRLLITKDLRKYATYIDLEAGVTRSEYITEGNLRRFIK